jgi:hypothetical protein
VPVGVLPDQHSQRQIDPDAGIGLHHGGADARVAEDQQDVGFQFDIGLAGTGGMVDAREQLQAMRVERLLRSTRAESRNQEGSIGFVNSRRRQATRAVAPGAA